MKQITKTTLLKQKDKAYQPFEVDGVIYWLDKKENHWVGAFNIDDEDIVAQSQPKLDGVPVVSLNKYIQKIAENNWDLVNQRYKDGLNPYAHKVGFIECLKSNTNQYTQADIAFAVQLARSLNYNEDKTNNGFTFSIEEILEQINSISVIEVDEQFNVISYE